MNQNHLIYHLRETQMDDKLQAQLSAIISAYRPHDPIPTRAQLEGDKHVLRTGTVTHSYVSLKGLKQQVETDFAPEKDQ